MIRNYYGSRYLDEALDFMEVNGVHDWIFELAGRYSSAPLTPTTVLELYNNNDEFKKKVNSYIVARLSNIDDLRALDDKENGKHIRKIVDQRATDLIKGVTNAQVRQKLDDLTFLSILANFCKDFVLLNDSKLNNLPFCANITEDEALLKDMCDAIGVDINAEVNMGTLTQSSSGGDIKLKAELAAKYQEIQSNFNSSAYEAKYKTFIKAMDQALSNIFEIFTKACSNKNGMAHVKKYYDKIVPDINAILSANDTLAKAKQVCALFYEKHGDQYISRKISEDLEFTSEYISTHMEAIPMSEDKFNKWIDDYRNKTEKPAPERRNRFTDRDKIKAYDEYNRIRERDIDHLKKGHSEIKNLSKKLYAYYSENTGTIPRWYLEYVKEGKSRSGFMHGTDVLTGYGKFKDQSSYESLGSLDKRIVALAVVYSLCNISKQIEPLMDQLQSIVTNFTENLNDYADDFADAVYKGFRDVVKSILDPDKINAEAIIKGKKGK